jgi:transposase
MQKLNDLNRSPTPLKPDGTLIAVIEMSLSSWLVAGIVPGVERLPLKKLEVDESTTQRKAARDDRRTAGDDEAGGQPAFAKWRDLSGQGSRGQQAPGRTQP